MTEHRGFTVWFTGLSGAGKSTIAEMLYHEFQARGMKTEILDGDVVRQKLSKGLGFSKEDRDLNIMRIGFVANLLTRNGVATICCPISPYREARNAVRAEVGDFVEVYVHATVAEIAANRDPKASTRRRWRGSWPASRASIPRRRTRRRSTLSSSWTRWWRRRKSPCSVCSRP